MPRASATTSSGRHLILGTAGHVDHGKTELVRALTGLETDRLKEEKERGISIELGFAPLPLDEDIFLGVIDVLGHERFVKQMVSGAGGIDMVILLIAADEGVMPQTQEHMEVLNSLRIKHGAVVISKVDLADEDTRLLLEDEIADLTAGSFLEGAPIVATSAKTGEGMDRLRDVLRQLAHDIPPRPTAGPFRLAVDRVFHQKGIGVVVTGSCYSGSIRPGDALELVPSPRAVRVRELQSFGQKREVGSAGERLAVALQGVKLDEVLRGDMLCSRSAFSATDAIDIRLKLGNYDRFELKNRERIRIHHGAREVLGRVILLETDTLSSGEDALVQIKLETSIVTAQGDDVVIRKYSPARVVGGGIVIDRAPPRHKRFDEVALERLRIHEQGDPLTVFCKTVENAGLAGVPLKGSTETLDQAVKNETVIIVADHIFHTATVATTVRALQVLVDRHIDRHPLSWGLAKEELRQKLAFPHGPQLFNRFLDVVAKSNPVFVRGAKVRTGVDTLNLTDIQKRSIAALSKTVAAHGVAFPMRKELEQDWRDNENFHDVLQYLQDTNDVLEVGDEGLISVSAMQKCLAVLNELFGNKEDISVADLKDALGLSRKHTVPLLEYFDDQKVTRRVGNVRVKGSAFPAEDNH